MIGEMALEARDGTKSLHLAKMVMHKQDKAYAMLSTDTFLDTVQAERLFFSAAPDVPPHSTTATASCAETGQHRHKKDFPILKPI